MIPEHTLLESCARLSVSLEGPSLFTNRSHSSSSHSSHSSHLQHNMTLDELRAVNRYAESTKSLSYLPQVRFNIWTKTWFKSIFPFAFAFASVCYHIKLEISQGKSSHQSLIKRVAFLPIKLTQRFINSFNYSIQYFEIRIKNYQLKF